MNVCDGVDVKGFGVSFDPHLMPSCFGWNCNYTYSGKKVIVDETSTELCKIIPSEN